MTKEQKADNLILLILALGGVLIHILLNGQYGFHRDELDFIMNARHLDWGYVSYPPITPFFARVGLGIFGESLRGLRVLPAIAQGIAMVLAGLIGRQTYCTNPDCLRSLHHTCVPDGRHPHHVLRLRLSLVGNGGVLHRASARHRGPALLAGNRREHWLGHDDQVHDGILGSGLVVAVVLTSARKYSLSKWLYLGAAVTLLIFLPNLIWQMRHDFIAFNYLSAIHTRDIRWGRADDFLPNQLIETTNSFSLPLWTVGLGMCLFGTSMKRFRALGWMLSSRSRCSSSTRAGVITRLPPMDAAVPGMRLVRGLARGADRENASDWIRLVMGHAGHWESDCDYPDETDRSDQFSATEVTSNINEEVTEMVGWQDLPAQVAEIYQPIPEFEKSHTVILAYLRRGWRADLYGHDYGLPRIISGANSLWYRGYGQSEPKTVIVVGSESYHAANFFNSCEFQGPVKNSFGVKNEETTHHSSLFVCREPRQPWSEMWQSMKWYQ